MAWILTGCIFGICLTLAYRNGKMANSIKEMEQRDIVDQTAAHIRDRLKHHSDYAERVRQRFTR